MGRDIILLKVDEPQLLGDSISQLNTLPLGSLSEVISVIQNTFTGVDVSNPQWIVMDDKGHSLQITVYEGDPVEAVLVNIHGMESALEDVIALCKVGGWVAFDTSSGKFVHY